MWSMYARFVTFLTKTILNSALASLFLLLWDWSSHFLGMVNLSTEEADDETENTDIEKLISQHGVLYFFLDILIINLFFNRTVLWGDKPHLVDYYKNKQLSNNKFYVRTNNSYLLQTTTQYVFCAIKSAWSHLRLWLLPTIIALTFIYYSFVIKSLPFSKIIFGYIMLGNMMYLLVSGFVFFIKKYQFRLFTSVIQRFWRRTLVIFWLIEVSLFAVFIYLIFNASQEPMHVYDNIQVYKTHLYSWRYFLGKIILSTLLIIFTYLLLLSLKWNSFTKTNNIALIITVLLLYVAWLEFYQMFHLMNCYGGAYWLYSAEEHLWNLELDFKRTRIVNHYLTIGLVAKFWHVVFAVVFWVFFLLRGLESARFRYPLLVANLQNFLIIYIMSWLYMYPWFKYATRKILDMPYFWFFVNNRRFGLFLFFNDIKLYSFGLVDFLYTWFMPNKRFDNTPFYYWSEASEVVGFTQFRKHFIRDQVIKELF